MTEVNSKTFAWTSVNFKWHKRSFRK